MAGTRQAAQRPARGPCGVGAPDAFYARACIVYDKSRSFAADDWKSGMDDDVGHMESSLRLP